MRMQDRRLRAAALCAAAALAWAAPAPAGTDAAPTGGGETRADKSTRHTMDQIFKSISFLLPLSLTEERFADPALREKILESLDSLARNGARLEHHGQQKDASFRFLSRSLARDTSQIRDRFAEGRVAEARYLLHQVTEDCVACHSRLPSDRSFPLGERFVTGTSIAELAPEDRAALEIATRQFDRALETLEGLIASPEVSPGTLDLRGYFDDYLELCIRVRGDLDRPTVVIETFLQRNDLSPSLRANATSWLASLRTLRQRQPLPDPIDDARALIAEAEAQSRYPNDRRALVYYIAASSVLHRVVDSQGDPGPKAGEAYYLLGLIESRIGRSFWLSQTEFFLETAIRLDPSQPYAAKAYDLLEEFIASGYTGSAGQNIPEDVQRRLDELRELINRS